MADNGFEVPRHHQEFHLVFRWISRGGRDTIARPFTVTVCTGSALLAKTGLLDGRRATTNKLAFNWVSAQGPRVRWVAQARWVEDGKFFTASGVSAGLDGTLALVEKIGGAKVAQEVARWAEYDRHTDAGWDPFAQLAGLVVPK